MTLWKRWLDTPKDGYKTFVVIFDEHCGNGMVKVVVKAREEYAAIDYALPFALTLNKHIHFAVCEHCGEPNWYTKVHSPDVSGDYANMTEYAEDIKGLAEYVGEDNLVLALGVIAE